MEKLMTKSLYDLSKTKANELLEKCEYPWEALPKIGAYIVSLGDMLEEEIYEKKGENIWIAKNAKIDKTASITGPAIIGENTEIRHCAFIRGNALIGNNVVVGNSTELKNTILFDNVQVPHYNYVGDSILGYKAHMGAGSIASNVRSDKKLVIVKGDGETRNRNWTKKIWSYDRRQCRNRMWCSAESRYNNRKRVKYISAFCSSWVRS